MIGALKSWLKGKRDAWRKRRREARIKAAQPTTRRGDIVRGLRAMGVRPGDTLFLHSSLKSLGFVEGGPAEVIDALLEAVGPEGTLMLPTYYLPGGTIAATIAQTDYVFDPRVHGTSMGALPEALLARRDVERSIHPTHSVGAVGRHAKYLTQDHHRAPSVFGEGSPWQRFVELPGAKVLGLGISMGPVTFYHLIEDELGDAFPERVWGEPHDFQVRDFDGRAWSVPVRPYRSEVTVRRIDTKRRADLRTYFAKVFDEAGLRRKGRVGQADAWIIDAAAFRNKLLAMAAEGVTIYTQPVPGAAAPEPPKDASAAA